MSFTTGTWLKQLLDAANGRPPGASGGSTGDTIILRIWVLRPDPTDPLNKSQLFLWGAVYGREDIARW